MFADEGNSKCFTFIVWDWIHKILIKKLFAK